MDLLNGESGECLSLQDFIISASAKGVLLVPEEAIPNDMTIEDFAEEWVKYNGVIKVKTKKGIQLPKQIVANSTNLGINDMINLQIKLRQSIKGLGEWLISCLFKNPQ
ncbi:MAG: hypothetical protein BGO30_08565 [Bacteroidetes bacterium 41-46]|nr:MAG: hypothetical protein BGO30_08565 [Bacteroidetes bacterium 41-46]